jgi:hypothetical protein
MIATAFVYKSDDTAFSLVSQQSLHRKDREALELEDEKNVSGSVNGGVEAGSQCVVAYLFAPT